MAGITIAIDGYSSCGKSTLAKELAKDLGYIYVDSGAMYRAVTLHMMRSEILEEGIFDVDQVIAELPAINIGFSKDAESGKIQTILNGENVEDAIRKPAISENVSAISAISEVRQKLVGIQQQMGQNGSVIMDGRDIGTVVFPDADLKIFMTASVEVRAKRRYDELIAKGEDVQLDEVAESIQRRDELDMNREISPLKKAEDAIELDNSDLDRDQQFAMAKNLILRRLEEKSGKL